MTLSPHTLRSRTEPPNFLTVMARFDDALIAKREASALCVVMFLFILFAAFSLVDSAMALGACCALVFGVALLWPQIGLLLTVSSVPIQTIFQLPREHMQVYLACGLVAVSLRHIHLVPVYIKQPSAPIILIPAALAAMTLFWLLGMLSQLSPAALQSGVQEAVFFATLFVIAVATYRYAAKTDFRTGLVNAAALSLAITVCVDVVRTYVIGSPETSVGSALASLRLAGLHVNPNATGKYLALGVLLACTLSWTARQLSTRVGGLVVGGLAMLALSATMSKAALIGFAGALIVGILHALIERRWRVSAMVAATLAFMLGMAGAWELLLYPVVRDATISRFAAPPEAAPVQWHATQRTPPLRKVAESLLSQVKRDFRLDQSYTMRLETKPQPQAPPNSEMYRTIPGKIDYVKRDCGWSCAGQRDRLWLAGIETIRHHWLFGIGPGQWPAQMQSLLGFPFDSPHNSLLELWGKFGLLGLAIWLVSIALIVRLAWTTLSSRLAGIDRLFAGGSALYLIAILITELFDPAKYLAFSPHTIWLWIFIGGLSRTVEIPNMQDPSKLALAHQDDAAAQ